MDALTEEIAGHRRELRADPRSLRFVPLADALRRAGALDEALRLLDDGLALHPQHASALLVRARVLADAGRTDAALAVLDALYGRDRANLPVAELYVELLACVGRVDEARAVVTAAELAGAPSSMLERMVALVAETDDIESLDAPEALISLHTLNGAAIEELEDVFLTEPVVRRVLRSGSREAGARLWAEWRAARGGAETSTFRPRLPWSEPKTAPRPAEPAPSARAVPRLQSLLAVLEAAAR